MQIEVVGLGGAGKSSVMSLVRERFPEKALFIDEPVAVAPITALFKAWTLGYRLAFLTPGPAFSSLRSFGGRWLFLKLGYRLAAFARRDHCRPAVLVDSGFLEPLITHAMYFSRRSQDLPWATLLDLLPRPSAVIFFRCDTETAYRRFVAREVVLQRLEAWGGSDGLRLRFDDAQARCEWLYNYCIERNITVTTIDTTDLPSDVEIDRLRHFILSQLQDVEPLAHSS